MSIYKQSNIPVTDEEITECPVCGAEQAMNKARAEIIVDAIIRDLTNRRGLRHEWDRIDEDIKQEIRDEWISIVRTVTAIGRSSK